ncbi:calcium-binding protein [Sphingomonas sp.]|uniref:calcium-binding protein n=1 Tax=Sphingomonas sp. TaxID=28214 RepID=UPI0035C7CEC3
MALQWWAATATEDFALGALIGPHVEAQKINGTSGNDRLRGTRGADVIRGLAGDDRIDAEDGNDRVIAGAGNDRIEGEDGNDRIIGGSGDDRIDGDDGNDTLTGGKGADTFVFDDDNQRDVITDFKSNDFIYFDYESRDRNAVYGMDDFTITDTAKGAVLAFDRNHIVLLRGVEAADIDASQFLFNPEPRAALDPVL